MSDHVNVDRVRKEYARPLDILPDWVRPIPSCRTVVDGLHNTSQMHSLVCTEGICRTADDVDTDGMYAGLPLFGMQSWTRNT